MNSEIILSILIPTYNRCDKLKYTVENLIRQVEAFHREGVEIIISNNASTDDTGNYLDTLRDYPFVTTNTNSANLGYGGNVRWLVAHASGAYLQILSDDDAYSDDLIRRELQAITLHKSDYYYVPSSGALPSGGERHVGSYRMTDFIELYRMGMALCSSNIFLASKAKELSVKSDVWFHCELLYNMNPDSVYVIDDVIDVKMPAADDQEYWHNDPDTILDYDTQILEVIDQSKLSDVCKGLLFSYYKNFLFDEIYRYIKAGPYHRKTNLLYAERIEKISIFDSETKYLQYENRGKALVAGGFRYYSRRFASRLRGVLK